MSGEKSTIPDRGRTIKCYNCGAARYIARQCKEPERSGIIDARAGTAEPKGKVVTNRPGISTSMGLVELEAPYIISIKFCIDEIDGSKCKHVFESMIDSGSLISVICEKYVPKDQYELVDGNQFPFSGLNGSKLKIIGRFETIMFEDIKINIVLNETMSVSKHCWAEIS